MTCKRLTVNDKGTRMHAQTLTRSLVGGLAALLCSLTLATAATAEAIGATPAPQVFEVAAGGQRTLRLDKPVQRVAVGDGEIAQVKPLNKQELLLQGMRPGTTTLLVWHKSAAAPLDYRIQVSKAVDEAVLGDYPGLRLKASGDLLLLGGTVASLEQHEAARQVAVHADGSGKAPLLDTVELPFSSQVLVDVRIVEMSRKVIKQAGINLFSSASNAITYGTFAPNSSVFNAGFGAPISKALNLLLASPSGDIRSILSILEGNGFARTLAQPSLVAQSGQSANFIAGGEIPITVTQPQGQSTTQFKPYGIRLDVAPTVLAGDRIAMKIASEVSEPVFKTDEELSHLTSRRAETTIELGDGESFVIGGLVSQSVAKNIDKIPGLGDIPVLGTFFKSVNLSREDKELLVIVSPRLVRPVAAGNQLGPLPGAEVADYNPSLWEMLITSDSAESGRFTGLSK